MAMYNHTRKLLLGGDVSLASLKCMLVGPGYTFDASHTNVSSASGQEVSGNGWTSGGEALANVAASVVNTNEAKLTADNLSKTASGGAIGPANGYVIYDSNNSNLLSYANFGGAKSADDGADFKITWDNNGIFSAEASS